MTYSLSACADTLFCQFPFEQRAQRIAAAGFQVEFWAWHDRDIDALARDPQITANGSKCTSSRKSVSLNIRISCPLDIKPSALRCFELFS